MDRSEKSGGVRRAKLALALFCAALAWLALPRTARAGEKLNLANAEAIFQEAWYREEGLRNLQAAIEYYHLIVREFPDEPNIVARARLRSVICYIRLGQLPKAEETYWQAYMDYPGEIRKIPEYYHQEVANVARKFDQAFSSAGQKQQMDFFKKILDSMQHPDIEKVYHSLLSEAERLRKTDPMNAIDTLQKTIAVGMYLGQNYDSRFLADGARLQSLIGEIYLQLDRPYEAIQAFHRVQDSFPTEGEAGAWGEMRVAEIYRQMNQLTEAIEIYSQVPLFYPDQRAACAWARLWMGDAFRERGELAQAYVQWGAVLDYAEADDTRLPRRIARWLLGREVVPDVADVAPPWANDMAYFIGVKHELDGRPDEAFNYFVRCIELSESGDWPAAIARKIVDFYTSPK